MFKMNDTILKVITSFDGTDMEIPITYFMESKYGHFLACPDMGKYPKQIHGKLITEYIKQTQPKQLVQEGLRAVYCIMETRCLPFGEQLDEQTKTNLEKWKQLNGSFEGFPGILDYGLVIAYHDKGFSSMYVKINIDENNVRSYEDLKPLEAQLNGIFADNIMEVFNSFKAVK